MSGTREFDTCRGCGRHVKGCAGECEECFPVQCSASAEYVNAKGRNFCGPHTSYRSKHAVAEEEIIKKYIWSSTKTCQRRLTRSEFAEFIGEKLLGHFDKT